MLDFVSRLSCVGLNGLLLCCISLGCLSGFCFGTVLFDCVYLVYVWD